MRKKLLSLILIGALSISVEKASAGLYNDAGPAVVWIHVSGELKTSTPGVSPDYNDYATGFLVSPDGLIFTAGHVAVTAADFQEGTLAIEVEFPSLKEQSALVADLPTYTAKVVKSETFPFDVALLKIVPDSHMPSFRYLRLCDGYSPDDELRIMGFSLGSTDLTNLYAHVSTPAHDSEPMQIGVALDPGTSGAPIFNPSGKVVALNMGRLRSMDQTSAIISLGLPVGRAIAEMAPEGKPIVGSSYVADCSAPAQAGTPQVFTLISSVPTPTAVGVGQILPIHFNAPQGLSIQKVDPLSTNSSSGIGVTPIGYTIAPDGSGADVSVRVTSVPQFPLNTVLGGAVTISARLEGFLNANQPIAVSNTLSPEIRSFPISRIFADHAGLFPLTETFHDNIDAPAGYVFTEVRRIHNVSLNHSPSDGAKVDIIDHGHSLLVTYTLQSGPIYDQWRGWIDALVDVQIVPQH